MSLEGNKNRIHEGILDSLRRSQKRQSILDMRFARNKRAFGRAWDKTVERFGGKRGETTNPIIKGIMPDGSEAPGHRGRWKKTQTSNPRDKQWLQTYRQERSARLKRSDAVWSSLGRIAAGVLAGTMALTGRGLLTPNVVNKAVMDKKQELRQSIDNKQRRDEMSLENTLREMLNEMKKMPEKGQLDPTVHTGPEKPALGSTVHSGPKGSGKYKETLKAHEPKPKTVTEVRSFEVYGDKGPLRSGDAVAKGMLAAPMIAALGLGVGKFAGSVPTVLGQLAADKQTEVARQTQDAHITLQGTAKAKGLMKPKGVGAAQPMSPGMTKTVTAKPRRRLEETLKDHYKQRLQEGLLRNIGKAVSQMDLSPGSLARATGRTASRVGNLVRGRGFKTGEDIAYEKKEARAEAQRQITPDAPKPTGRSGFVASAEERKAAERRGRAERENEERSQNIRRRMLKDPRTDEISAWGGA